jgi:potassium-transporting ATPase KdpC subunit
MHAARDALKMLFAMIVLTGILYPLVVTLIVQLAMPKQAGGSLLRIKNRVVGSELIAQNFKGEAYFWPRPSAVDFNPIKPAGGSNLGPTSQKLKEIVMERMKTLGSDPPSELVYSSGSGLDPHISLKTAYFQLERIARARSIPDHARLRSLIDSLAEGYKKNYVNVLMLNMALDQQFPQEEHE